MVKLHGPFYALAENFWYTGTIAAGTRKKFWWSGSGVGMERFRVDD
jgi:hypothetical protein